MPHTLQPGGKGTFTIDVASDVVISGQREWIAVTFPDGVTFPEGGVVRYIADGTKINDVLQFTWDPHSRQLRFQSELHLNDGTRRQNGFYSIDVQARPDAAPGLRKLANAIEIAGVKADVEFEIVSPRPAENLIKNGGFGDVPFKPDGKWTPNQGVLYARKAAALDWWSVGTYQGKGVWAPSRTGAPGELVDVINGDADGHFPEDKERPFAAGENIVDVNGANTCGYIEQAVTVTAGTWYELSFHTGYHLVKDDPTGPTYLHTDVRYGEAGAETVLVEEDYVQYYTGKNGISSQDPGKKLNKPGWRKRRLRFLVPDGVSQVTVRFANPGPSGFNPELFANPGGSNGMLVAHVGLVPSAPDPYAARR
ncbi:hypothetical protein [Streptomyces sp. NPDC049555]|uniref:hypothetical protein n=1 Tax=Streptomyces sp. NPDC049555 TaxID=3154930 RepID=UPI0034292ABE